MKGFIRKNQLLSLCGLNCGLCPMLLGGHCGGCGNGNQSCAIARCSLEQGAPEYCCDCPRYPCEKYAHFDEFDSFSTHQGRRADMARAQAMGIAAYNREQEEKIQILDALLSQCNDGRRKTLFCVAVNLLEVTELREAMEAIHTAAGFQDWPLKERAAYAVGILQEIAHRRNLSLKLHRKK